MALVCTFFPSSLSPPKGATGMCLVDVPEYIPNFEKHVTVGFFFFFGKYCFSCKYTLLRCDRAPASRCLPSTTCLRNLSRRWAPGAPLGRGFCRRPRVPGSASRPCPAVAVPSARAPDPGKEASAEPQATRRPANRAAGLSPTKAAHAAPPPCGGLVSSHLCHSLYHPTNLKKLATYYYVRTAPTLLAEWSVSSHTC